MPKKPVFLEALSTALEVADCADSSAPSGLSAAASANRYRSVVALAAIWSRRLGILHNHAKVIEKTLSEAAADTARRQQRPLRTACSEGGLTVQQLAALYLTPVARALAPRRLCLVVAAWALCAESILHSGGLRFVQGDQRSALALPL